MDELGLFTAALGLSGPWRVTRTEFDVEAAQLDLYLGFDRGARFGCPAKDCAQGGCAVHDTVDKTGRHLESRGITQGVAANIGSILEEGYLMHERTDEIGFPTVRLDAELNRLRAMDLSPSADLAIRASRPTESSDSTGTVDRERVETVAGAFVGARTSLVAGSEVETRVAELERILSLAASDSEDKERMLDLWTVIEPHLLAREIDDLRPAALARIFGGQESQIGLSRGGQPRGGGD